LIARNGSEPQSERVRRPALLIGGAAALLSLLALVS
jgi:hypothetical protein